MKLCVEKLYQQIVYVCKNYINVLFTTFTFCQVGSVVAAIWMVGIQRYGSRVKLCHVQCSTSMPEDTPTRKRKASTVSINSIFNIACFENAHRNRMMTSMMATTVTMIINTRILTTPPIRAPTSNSTSYITMHA